MVSATAHVYPPAGLKPRYLATGTGVSLPSTSSPPYPTGTANGTTIPTYSSTSPSTAIPTPTSSEFFYLVISDIGTSLDGDYLTIGSDFGGSGLYVLYPGDEPDSDAKFSTFSINTDGTFQNEFVQGIAYIFSEGTDDPLVFAGEVSVDENGGIKSICAINGGVLTCQTGTDVVFFVCPFNFTLEAGGTVDVGPITRPGCTPITLLAVPI